MKKHYDVVVLGRSIGSLVAAALLARRGFTVVVLGQGERAATYAFEGRTFARRAFTLLAATSPAWRRVVVELAQSQTWKRRVSPLSPMMQVIAPRRRLDVPPDMTLLGREIDRELPELRRLVEDLYAELARVNGAADEAFEHDAVWPPGTFWERRETGRYAALLPYARAEPDADLLADFPRHCFFRDVVQASVTFATDLSATPPPFAVARLHGAWTRGPLTLGGGEAELEAFLVDRIAAHGGQCLLDERASSIQVKRGGAAAGVIVDGDENVTGADFVISDAEGEVVARLAKGEGIHKRAQREWPRITSSVGRFVASIIVRREALPAPLAAESFFVPGDRKRTRDVPPIHLVRGEPDARGEVLLTAEMLLPDRGPPALVEARQAVLDALAAELPFLERHVVAADSVHDGLPLWIWEDGRRRTVARSTARGAPPPFEPMIRKIEVDPPGYLGLSGEPIRGPVERTLLVGRSVLPALGQEGQLLAAWGAARLVTRTDRQRERMRREMWNKSKLGDTFTPMWKSERSARALALALGAAAVLGVSGARADEPGPDTLPITVVGIQPEGADDQAEALTKALKNAVRAMPGWSASDGDFALEVLTLSLKCADPPDATCESRIADQIHADRFIWGRLEKKGDQVKGQLHFWVRGKGSTKIDVGYTANLTEATDETLKKIATDAFTSLSGGPPKGTIHVKAGIDGQVFLDGQPLGALAAGEGSFPAPSGPHRVVVKAVGYADAESSIVVKPNVTADVAVTPTKQEVKSPTNWRRVGGMISLGVGVGATVVGVVEALRVNSIQNDPKFKEAVSKTPETTTACDVGATPGSPVRGQKPEVNWNNINQQCKDASSALVMQVVFFSVGAVAGGAGIFFIATSGKDSKAAPTDARGWSVLPTVSPTRSQLQATYRF